MRGTVPFKGTVPVQCRSGLYDREVELLDSPLAAQLDESHRRILSVDSDSTVTFASPPAASPTSRVFRSG